MANVIAWVDGKAVRLTLTPEEIGETTVAQLKARVTQKAPQLERMNLLYCGRLLNQEGASLASFGVKRGSCVHAIKEPTGAVAKPIEPKNFTDQEIKSFCLALEMAIQNPALGNVLKRLTDRENLESLVAACPGLVEDPVALALLSKPEMLLMLLKMETVKKLGQQHPSLCEALSNLAAAVHEERATTSRTGPGPSAGDGRVPAPFSYHLDELSGQDDDDEEQMEVGEGIQRNRSFSAITPDQLAAAIAAAQGNSDGPRTPATGSVMDTLFGGMTGMTAANSNSARLAEPAASSSAAPQAITPDMFRAAMEQAMASATARPQQPSDEEKIEKMREMGIVDEGLARQALKVMDGDLQAAIDLILSGWVGENESDN